MEDALQYLFSQLPGAGIASAGWGIGIVVRGMWKEYKRRGRREHGLKKMGLERGLSLYQDSEKSFNLYQDPGGFRMGPRNQRRRPMLRQRPKPDQNRGTDR